ncbi:NAD(P)/FAD-dependent oxidoreductase [Geminicoccaceae bacterium 1502E]|nr:NAD(P)/FAD-dependent oxidoreductase [Geminicoccaceae bacterium 1502E]
MPHRIVIVGGGAGGLVLATRLGNRLGRDGRAEVTLVDPDLIHIWKPLLHEIAAGTLNSFDDSVSYLSHAKAHGFRFVQGMMNGLDRQAKEVVLAPLEDVDGRRVVGERRLGYDTLVLAVGSVSNDFGVPGVQEHCVFLDDQKEAERLHERILLDALNAPRSREGAPVLSIAIVGAGATGVELAAELHKATRQLAAYGPSHIDPERDVRFTLLEAAPRVLPALPERLSELTREELERLGIEVLVDERVEEATAEGIRTASRFVPARIRVWCAGIQAPRFLRELGLETGRGGQVVVDQTLRSVTDSAIFALGDCASCPQPGSDRPVPPRAQAAHQQAMTLERTLTGLLDGGEPVPFTYKDYGSLVSLSYGAVGSLMGNLFGRVMLEGRLARAAYVSLYRKHQMALHGVGWLVLATVARLFARGTRPRLKLH